MRILLLLLLALPASLFSQVNRSATELAKENVQEYLSKKVFKGQPYKSVSFSELRSQVETKLGMAWNIDHKFLITEKQRDANQQTSNVEKPYKFIFYFDDRMKILKAESYLVL